MTDFDNKFDQQSFTIIIPVFNQLKFTRQCLRSIFRNSDHANIKIIVVDNGSTDGTKEFLLQACKKEPRLTVRTLSRNFGFNFACNVGATEADGNYIVFLNNDTIVKENWLKNMFAPYVNNQKVGVVGSKLIYPFSGQINHFGYVYNISKNSFYPIYHDFDSAELCVSRDRIIPALLGAAIMIDKNLFKSIGGFSQFGLEDIDLCLKVAQQGLHSLVASESIVLHYGSVTLRDSNPLFIPEMNTKEFNSKWTGNIEIVPDVFYYKADGFTIEEFDSGRIVLSHADRSSFLKINAARKSSLHNIKECIEALEEVLEVEPNNKTANNFIAKAFKSIARLDSALMFYMKCNLLDSNDVESLLNAMECANEIGREDAFIDSKNALLKNNDCPFQVKEKAAAAVYRK